MYDERALACLAARQHGVFTLDQARVAGFTNGTIDRRVQSGSWERVDHGVLRLAGAPPSWRSDLLAACFAGRALASHRSAAALHGLDGFGPGPPELVIPRGRRFRRAGQRIHEIRDFDLCEELQLTGIPTTGIGSTLFHLGAVVGRRRQGLAIDDAIRQHLISWEELYRTLVLHARRGRKGTRQLRSILDERYGQVVPDSSWSRMVFDLLLDAGLPEPVLEYEIYDAYERFVARVDLAWPRHKVALELQSRRWHLGELPFERDPLRRNAIQGLGWTVLEYTWRFYVDHPNLLCNQVRGHLGQPTAPHRTQPPAA